MAQIAEPAKPQSRDGAEIVFGKSVALSGITNVVESDDKKIVASMGGNTLTITGEGLNIDALDVAKQTAQLSGSVSALTYSKGREKLSLLKKLMR